MTKTADPQTPGQRSQAAVQAVLDDLERLDQPGLVVDAPPGAGKSTLVVAAALGFAERAEPCMIVAQTNNQVDDLIERIAAQSPETRLGRLSAGDYTPSAAITEIRDRGTLQIDSSIDRLTECDLVLATAAKWAWVDGARYPWAIVDEAYQMRSDLLLQVAPRFEQAIFVGDPGQLDPFSIIDTPRWKGLPHDPTNSAVEVLLNHHPNLPQHRLPLSWRLPASAAPVVARAFYPFLGFHAATARGERHLSYTTAGFHSPYDDTLAMAARTGWALHELPARHVPRTDPETANEIAGLAGRLLERRPLAVCERHPHGRQLAAADIAIGVTHRDQADQIRRILERHPAPSAREITVDTANRLQGREYEITIIAHPLSGRHDATNFHLESGRLCVLASRHRHACIVVARAGIADLLDAHPSTEPVHLNVNAKFPDGWEAHQELLTHLTNVRVRTGR